MNAQTAFHLAHRLTVTAMLALAASQRLALAASLAAPAADPLVDLGTKALQVILTAAGVAAAIGGAAVGLRLIVGSAVGSSYVMAQAVFALIGVVGGLALALTGADISKGIINSIPAAKTITVP